MSKSKKVIVAGHICLDITPVFSRKEPARLEEILVPGKLVHMNQAEVSTGGAVANTGLGMKLFGAKVQLMGKVGKDPFGEMVLRILEEYQAEGNMIVKENETTSYSLVIAPPGVDRIFLHNPGANDSFVADDITEEMLKDTVLFHFGYPTIMKRMYENQGEELVKLFQKLKEKGILTSLDMASIDPDSEAGAADWQGILTRVLPFVDFFVPSVEELYFMLDREKYDSFHGDITDRMITQEDVRPFGDMLMNMGAKVVLIKCGVPGMYYRTAGETVLTEITEKLGLKMKNWIGREGFEKSYVAEKVLSATGAGDTSIAGFLTAALKGYDLDRCLHLATAAGASCVTAYDALGGLRPLEELEKKIDAGWQKVQ